MIKVIWCAGILLLSIASVVSADQQTITIVDARGLTRMVRQGAPLSVVTVRVEPAEGLPVLKSLDGLLDDVAGVVLGGGAVRFDAVPTGTWQVVQVDKVLSVSIEPQAAGK